MVYLTVRENETLLRSVAFLMLTIPSISFAYTLNEHEQSTTMDARLQRHVHELKAYLSTLLYQVTDAYSQTAI